VGSPKPEEHPFRLFVTFYLTYPWLPAIAEGRLLHAHAEAPSRDDSGLTHWTWHVTQQIRVEQQNFYLIVFASWRVRSRLGQTIFFVSLSLFVEVTDIPLIRPRALSFLSFPVHHSAFRHYIVWDTASFIKHSLLKVFRLFSTDLRLQRVGDEVSLDAVPPPPRGKPEQTFSISETETGSFDNFTMFSHRKTTKSYSMRM